MLPLYDLHEKNHVDRGDYGRQGIEKRLLEEKPMSVDIMTDHPL
jgi:hypothetical protein